MDADLDTLATALDVRTDDLLKACPDRAPARPKVGIEPRITDAELITLAVMQALAGRPSEARWLRYACSHLRHLFPYLPGQPGCNKRLRHLAASLIKDAVDRVGPDHGWADPAPPRRAEVGGSGRQLAGAARQRCGWQWPGGHWLRHGWASWSLPPESDGGYGINPTRAQA